MLCRLASPQWLGVWKGREKEPQGCQNTAGKRRTRLGRQKRVQEGPQPVNLSRPLPWTQPLGAKPRGCASPVRLHSQIQEHHIPPTNHFLLSLKGCIDAALESRVLLSVFKWILCLLKAAFLFFSAGSQMQGLGHTKQELPWSIHPGPSKTFYMTVLLFIALLLLLIVRISSLVFWGKVHECRVSWFDVWGKVCFAYTVLDKKSSCYILLVIVPCLLSMEYCDHSVPCR